MRVLLTSHLALDEVPAGRFVASLRDQLTALGHETHVLIAPPADDGSAINSFAAMNDEQLAAHRDTLRIALDDEIHTFDPHIVHAQHVWLHGHLALEAGVPYVLTAWGEELAAVKNDVRFRRFAQEAAENAGRVFVDSKSLERDVIATFGRMDGHVVLACQRDRVTLDCAKTLVNAYRDVLIARFGSADRP